MLGNRDSEVAIFIEDKEMIPSYLNGELVNATTATWESWFMVADFLKSL